MQAYSDPRRASDPHALPDVEIFFVSTKDEIASNFDLKPGWYWWTCFPGCLPDSEPFGPFPTADAAQRDAEGGAA